ncbi:ABC transporter permease [Hoeflea prorocentri]|uniref:ABC transporter permease subunit n=1 Tax=Hoeflea prorocentri TaxID=1922333 RepID=A0A9X3UEM7_9HYPH|nr:ABC transporter permease subunit [Hoeflea prorocentri]MCY6379998.1 ABC transporter permease subunit [Hoeflea prorocentri]MDA5397798.1 ABC transporter permease subunit [Hoeflea prorocentri]
MTSERSHNYLPVALLFVGTMLLGAYWQPHNPHAVDLNNVLSTPSLEHWLGTDHLGRDVASRILAGARPSLSAIAIVIASSIGLGLAAGVAIGFGPPALSRPVRWLAQTALALPTLITALLLATLFGAGLLAISAALVASTWAPYALSMSALLERLRGEPYWLASLALGSSVTGAVYRHMLPNAWPAIGALAGADAGRAIILVASMGFLGLSADTGRPEWGAMVHEYRIFLFSEPRLVLAPVLATAMAAFVLNRTLDRS